MLTFLRRTVPLLLVVVLVGACAKHARQDAPPQRSDAFVQDLERRTFQWFWDVTNPTNGLVPDRWPTINFSSVAAIGFGLTAYGVGAERGYVARAEARDRTLTTLQFLV